MANPIIRPAYLDDVEAIISMLRSFYAVHLASDRPRWTTETPPNAVYAEWVGELLADPASGLVLVAEVDGVVAGYLIAAVEPESSRHWSPRAIYWHDLFVSPPHRRLGIARSLAEALLSWAGQTHPGLQLRLMTAAPNEAARAFFETLGFRACVVEMIKENVQRQMPNAE